MVSLLYCYDIAALETVMPGLLIRDLPAELHRRLKRRATENHRSLTKEALAILEAALRERTDRPTLAQLDRRRVRGTKPLADIVVRRGKVAGRSCASRTPIS